MEDFIQTFLNGYEDPAFLSDAGQGNILFTNEAVHTKLGFTDRRLSDMSINDLFKQNKLIRDQPVFEHNDDHYLVQNEVFNFSGTDYVKSVLQPYQEHAALTHVDFQKKMTACLIHRLRSPVNGAAGFLELLEETSLNDKQQTYLQAVGEGLDDLKSVLAQIEVLSQSKKVYETGVNMPLFAEQLLASFPEPQKKRIRVHIDEEANRVHTDFSLLQSIIKELLENALQHGAGEPQIVTVHFMMDRIRVKNAGKPIPEDQMHTIFYPFFSTKARNVGVGLAKCSNYANLLDMKLQLAENSAEEGISFDLVF